jgi:hypothetical protein
VILLQDVSMMKDGLEQSREGLGSSSRGCELSRKGEAPLIKEIEE